MVELQRKRYAEEVVAVRCPTCGGLRSVCKRHVGRYSGRCSDCISKRVVHRTQYHNYWLENFTPDEIRIMAWAIWG